MINIYNQTEKQLQIERNENYKEDKDGKRLYTFLLKNLNKRKITEEHFINGLYDIIKENIDLSEFNANLQKKLNE